MSSGTSNNVGNLTLLYLTGCKIKNENERAKEINKKKTVPNRTFTTAAAVTAATLYLQLPHHSGVMKINDVYNGHRL